jgi:hypothetical protein
LVGAVHYAVLQFEDGGARLLRFERDLIEVLIGGTMPPLSLHDRGRDRSRAVRHMV